MKQGQAIRDASHLYEVERRVEHAARPGFRIMELQLSPTQKERMSHPPPLVPTFRSSCYIAAPTLTNFGKSWALANILILVPLFYLKFLDRIRRCRNFK